MLYLLLHLSGVLSHLCECNKVYYTLRVFGNLFSDRSYGKVPLVVTSTIEKNNVMIRVMKLGESRKCIQRNSSI